MKVIASITPNSSKPPQFLADANFNEHAVRGLHRLRSDIYGDNVIRNGYANRIGNEPTNAVRMWSCKSDSPGCNAVSMAYPGVIHNGTDFYVYWTFAGT